MDEKKTQAYSGRAGLGGAGKEGPTSTGRQDRQGNGGRQALFEGGVEQRPAPCPLSGEGNGRCQARTGGGEKHG